MLAKYCETTREPCAEHFAPISTERGRTVTTLEDEYERRLVAAALRLHRESRLSGLWRVGGPRRVLIAALGIGVLAAPALAATRPWESTPLARIASGVGSVDRRVTAAFGVFRRPPAPDDALPTAGLAAVQDAQSQFQTNPSLARSVLDDVRGRAYLVPDTGGVCLVTLLAHQGIGGTTCASAEAAARSGIVSIGLPASPGGDFELTAVLPNDPATLTVRTADGNSQVLSVGSAGAVDAALAAQPVQLEVVSASGRTTRVDLAPLPTLPMPGG
jgi:hypothetical protein